MWKPHFCELAIVPAPKLHALLGVKNEVKWGVLGFSDFGGHFLILDGILEAQKLSKNLPLARGFVAIEYGPVAIHGDSHSAQNLYKY